MALEGKRLLFVEYYIECSCNGARAARKAGYSAKGARFEAHRLLQDPEVKAAIQKQLQGVLRPAEEIIFRLQEQADGVINEFLKIMDGKPYLDVAAVKRAGLEHLIKGISYTKSGDVVVQTYDAQAALEKLGRFYKLFTDSVDVTSKGEQVGVMGIDVVLTNPNKDQDVDGSSGDH